MGSSDWSTITSLSAIHVPQHVRRAETRGQVIEIQRQPQVRRRISSTGTGGSLTSPYLRPYSASKHSAASSIWSFEKPNLGHRRLARQSFCSFRARSVSLRSSSADMPRTVRSRSGRLRLFLDDLLQFRIDLVGQRQKFVRVHAQQLGHLDDLVGCGRIEFAPLNLAQESRADAHGHRKLAQRKPSGIFLELGLAKFAYLVTE